MDRRPRVEEPPIPDDVVFGDLDRAARAPLRTLTKDNAEHVGRHLVMVGRLLDSDPEAAYLHAQAAVRRAGRVDVVREAAGLAAYRTGRYAEALRELRTVRRLNGSSEHLAVMADAERGLGRPGRAIALSQEPEASSLSPEAQVELAIVVSGARLDLGQPEAAVAALSSGVAAAASGLQAARVAQARAAALEACGRPAEAAAALAPFSRAELEEASGETEEDVVVFDLEDDEADEEFDASSREGREPENEHGATDGDHTGDVAVVAEPEALSAPAVDGPDETDATGGGSEGRDEGDDVEGRA